MILNVAVGSWIGVREWRRTTMLSRAQQSLKNDRFADAREQLTLYLEQRPHDPIAHFLLAEACRREPDADLSAARQHLAQARADGHPAADVARAELCVRFQEHGDSSSDERELLRLAKRHSADEAAIREALVRGYIVTNRIDDALRQASAWVRQCPDDWCACVWRGALYQYVPRPTLAVADYQRALQLHPDRAEVERNLGLMLVQGDGDFAEALHYLQARLARDPSDLDARTGAARCYRALQQPEQARTQLESVLAQRPHDLDALLTLALVELDQDRPQPALAYLHRAEPLAMHVDNDAGLVGLRRLQPPANNVEGVKRVLAVTHLLSVACRRLGKQTQADTYQRRYDQVRTDFAELNQALADAQQHPTAPGLARKIGLLYIRVGMAADAVPWLRRALQANPNDREARQALRR